MSEIKCPVCNVGYVHESVNHWCCDYEFCPSYDETDTETYDILIRTRKALDVAVDALNKYTDASGNWWYGYEFQGHFEDYAGEYADRALAKITALTKGGDNE